ncbi:type IV secretion system protein B4 [Rhodobacterales bacterium]|nr:type IV secretion system protein B4 [Rhodobacterales bacterium]
MLLGTLMTGVCAVSAATLVSSKTRKYLLGDVEQDWLANELEFDQLLADNQTVVLKDGTFCRIFCLSGVSYETRSIGEQEVLAKGRASTLHQFLSSGSTLRVFGIKRQRDVSFQAEWPSVTLKEVGAAEQRLYQNAYSLSWYLVLTTKTSAELEKSSRGILTGFKSYGVRSVDAAQDHETPCELTRILNYLVCGDLQQSLCRLSSGINANLPASDIHLTTDGEIETFTSRKHLNRVIAVRGWPESVSGLLVSRLLALSGEIEVCQVIKTLDNTSQIALFTRRITEQRHNFFGTGAVLAELEAVNEDLLNNAISLQETQFQVTVRAKDEAELASLLDQVTAILDNARVRFSVETVGAATAWFNRMPGRDKLLRPLKITEANVASLWPFQFSPIGLWSSPFGDRPVRLFKTPTGQNYAFQFHVSDEPQAPGNYLMFAPTGGGKSTLILHLLGGLAKFKGVRNYVFDSKDGARFMIEAFGGIYQGYEELALNPLDCDLSDKSNRHQVRLLLQAMLGEAFQEDMDDTLHSALDMAMELEPGLRTLDNIYGAAFPTQSAIRKAFTKWVSDEHGGEGQFSHVFNAPRDQITGFLEKSFLVGINMNEALKDPVLGPPVVAHISGAISAAAKKGEGGFSIFIDEAANLLRNTGFREVVLEMYREYRKLNGLVGLAFQEPGALLAFDDASAIIENAQTLFFLPNSQAKVKNLEPFNLSAEQIAFIKGENEMKGGRQVLVVKRFESSNLNESTILDADLSGLGDALRFYRSGPAAVQDLLNTKTAWGAEWLAKL